MLVRIQVVENEIVLPNELSHFVELGENFFFHLSAGGCFFSRGREIKQRQQRGERTTEIPVSVYQQRDVRGVRNRLAAGQTDV